MIQESKILNKGFKKGHKGFKPIGSKTKEKNIDIKQIYEDLIGTFKSGKFYVYYHIDKCKNEIVYIGKGNNNRAWDFKKTSRNKNWIEYKNNNELDVKIIASNLSEIEAFTIEKALIQLKKPILNLLLNKNENTKQHDFTN